MTSTRTRTRPCSTSACAVERARGRSLRAVDAASAATAALACAEAGLEEKRQKIADELGALLRAGAPTTPRRLEAWQKRTARLEARLVDVDQCHPRRRAPTSRPILLPWPDLALPGGRRVQVTGRVLPVSEVITSHNPETWEIDPRYPGDTQERRYHADPVEQTKVTRIANDLRPDLLLARTPSALDGPPVVTPIEFGGGRRWIALGGNGRTMALRLALTRGRGDAYEGGLRNLTRRALPPGAILVREIAPRDTAHWSLAHWSRELNRPLGAGLDLTTAGVSLARTMPRAAVAALAGRDLASALRGPPGREALRALQEAGLVGLGERGLVEDEGLSEQGRALVRRALVGALLGSAEAIETLSPAPLDLLARSAASLIEAAAVGGQPYDLRPAVRAVVEDLSDALAYQGGIERWIVDPHLLTPATLRQPGAVDVLRAVVARTLPAVADRWLALARANPEGQAGLFGPGPEPIDELAQLVRSVTSST